MGKNSSWSENEIDLLSQNSNLSISELAKLLNRTEEAIRSKRYVLKITKKHQRWSVIENKIITALYPESQWNKLLQLLPNRSMDSITQRAGELGVVRIRTSHIGSLDNLLLDHPISYYWIGFLFADGHLSVDGKLVCNLSIKDKSHLNKLANYLNVNVNNNIKFPGICIQDKHKANYLRQKYDWHHRKTYNPPSLELYENLFCNKEFFVSWLIGFLDGDGSIVRDKRRIQDIGFIVGCHINWDSFLKLIAKYLAYHFHLDKPPEVRKSINNTHRMSRFGTHNKDILFRLWYYANKYQLPFLERKLGRVMDVLSNKPFI